ncbi:MAG: S1/P1 Nuclease [Blastocatellia bacterium]
MKSFFSAKRDFSSLSITDLLDAREAYHVHLTHLENVIATAVGRYRIRVEDPDAREPDKWRARYQGQARTLRNTVVKDWSWPCLLVFVDRWLEPEELKKADPDEIVPRFLYLPDGRIVPTCVILAEKQARAPAPLQELTFPDQLLGGGYPLVTEKQGQQNIASLGCLVTNGDTVFALTNRHVTGEAGRKVFTLLRGERVELGHSHANHLAKKTFAEVYADWPGKRSLVNLDAGLIEINDLGYWTAQVFGIGELDNLIDLHPGTISLDLIGCPVRAFGAASGEMLGEIQAFFYRYKSVGGFDYVSDLLIGPRPEGTPLKTRPGDSGTLWVFDPPPDKQGVGKKGERARRLRPLALQWGGHTFIEDGGESNLHFALATGLSTICRELDVEIVRDWNIGHSEYWGKVGHYKIAAKALGLVTNSKLKKLLKNNLATIAFDDEAIEAGQLPKFGSKAFVPLADVPDLVWRATRKKDEGNHFADMDEEGKGDFEGKTLLKLCADPANVDIAIWNQFYDSLDIGFKRGALPFRVWQIYNYMVEFVKKGKIAEFICAGGVLSHYIGDACQPLHVSFLHHGRPGHPEEERVHSVYETDMLDRFATDIIAGVNEALKNKTAAADVKGGHEAAVSVIELMRGTIKKLPPLTVIEAFNTAPKNQRLPHMFSELGKKTISCIADGCLRMAAIWASAWKEGGGNATPNTKLGEVNREKLMDLYNDKEFLPAFRLKEPEFINELE